MSLSSQHSAIVQETNQCGRVSLPSYYLTILSHPRDFKKTFFFFNTGKPFENWLLTPFPLPLDEFAILFFAYLATF